MTTKPSWRAMTPADLDGVVRVARASFPDHFEDRACFAERLQLYPQGCYALAAGASVVGYLIAYPWIAGSAPPLNSLIHQLPANPDLIYLHDLALHPDARGQGHTAPIIARLVDRSRADGWQQIMLVAVNQATVFWQKMGFEVADQTTKPNSYGAGAATMIRNIAGPHPAAGEGTSRTSDNATELSRARGVQTVDEYRHKSGGPEKT